ncbi:hypothetical protein AVEN_194612-1 [Araneus ventricosus]|uniref:ATP-dependent DNA helicase n=1 Tax=Araneus ventricosus TaxID=182803 RepID=A0A4Y2A876_ARAVE|nr:hypothetical protein AVEN_194612-1 [Araneus ventricosus]
MRQQLKEIEFIIIDEISMVSYQMLCMVDSRLRQLKNKDNEFFGGINILVFRDLMQLPPIRRSGNPVYQPPQSLQPAVHLWRFFTLRELVENMRQQGDTTFIDIMNALRIGEMRTEHFAILIEKINKESTGEFAIDKALRIYPTLQQVNDHSRAVLDFFKAKGTQMYKIKEQDKLVDATRNLENTNLKDIIPIDINKTTRTRDPHQG